MESKLQSKVLTWLREQGAYVIKTQPGAGTPTGCPDIIGFKKDFWFALEIKASMKSHFQPLQHETLLKLSEWSYCKVVYPENWDDIRSELGLILDFLPAPVRR